MKLLHEAALGGAGVSVVFGLLNNGYLGGGLFSVQLTVTLSALCLAPLLLRASAKLPLTLRVACGMLVSVFAVPVLFAFLAHLFTGHRRADASIFDALWRVPAILACWIGFAKLNEGYIRPALREMPFFNKPGGISSMGTARYRAVEDKRTRAMDAVKVKITAVVKRRKAAEQVVAEKTGELEAAKKSAKKSQTLYDKKKSLLKNNADDEDIADECEAMRGMAKNAEKYVETLTGQIEAAKKDITACGESKKNLQKEWDVARMINSETTFYR